MSAKIYYERNWATKIVLLESHFSSRVDIFENGQSKSIELKYEERNEIEMNLHLESNLSNGMDLVKFFIFLAMESKRSCRVIKPIKNGRERERRERVLKFFYGQRTKTAFFMAPRHISVFLF